MANEDEQTKQLGWELGQALQTALVASFDRSFADVVHDYRRIEEDFVHRPGSNDFHVLETKRRIAEMILIAAHSQEQPFEVCQEIWNELLALGFTNHQTKRNMAWFYADSCLSNAHYDAGLEVIEPVIAEFEQWIQEKVRKPKGRKLCEEELERLKFLREGLIALRTGGGEAEAWLERDEARGPSPEKLREDELGHVLFQAMQPITAAAADRSFAELERQYREVETDFLASLQPGDESFVPIAKESITRAIFKSAHAHRQPFDVCRDLWNELAPWDFGHLEHTCPMIQRYAECCLFNGQSEAGLAVVEPFLAELQRQVDTDTGEELSPKRYLEEIARLQKLRDELAALPR